MMKPMDPQEPRPASRPFPIPLVSAAAAGALGPGSQPDDPGDPGDPGVRGVRGEGGLNVLPLPHDMATYVAPPLPEPEALAAHPGCVQVLREALAQLHGLLAEEGSGAGAATRVVNLAGLDADERALLNQVLGEGEVAAQVLAAAPAPAAAGPGALRLRVQESVFAGLWRVLHLDDAGAIVGDRLEVGALPQALVDAAAEDTLPQATGSAASASSAPPTPSAASAASAQAPAGVMNAPSLLAELHEQRRRWRPGDAPHVINLTLLPLTDADSEHLTREIGEGRVVILSRGYGNCRITSTRLARTWRVTYFNSTDRIILDTLEVSRVPEVACASREDLESSAERVAEVLQWVQAA